MNNICILTNYRCGSTAFAQDISKKYNLANLDEVFRGYDSGVSPNNAVYKLIPLQVSNLSNIARIIENSEKIIYLYRRNFIEQAKSYITASVTGNWHSNFLPKEVQINQKQVDFYVHRLITAWEMIRKMYRYYSGDVYCYEDYFAEEKYQPYKKAYLWPSDISIKDYNTEHIFKDTTHESTIN